MLITMVLSDACHGKQALQPDARSYGDSQTRWFRSIPYSESWQYSSCSRRVVAGRACELAVRSPVTMRPAGVLVPEFNQLAPTMFSK